MVGGGRRTVVWGFIDELIGPPSTETPREKPFVQDKPYKMKFISQPMADSACPLLVPTSGDNATRVHFPVLDYHKRHYWPTFSAALEGMNVRFD